MIAPRGGEGFAVKDERDLHGRGEQREGGEREARDGEAVRKKEFRDTVDTKIRVLGAEHPDTLSSRIGLASALSSEGKNTETEIEYRSVIAIQERVPGLEHPDVFLSCINLALCLEAQQKATGEKEVGK